MPRSLSQLAVFGTATVACALLTGCASRPMVVESTPLWPFEKVIVAIPGGGTTTGYVSRANSEARRLVIVVQTSPCAMSGLSPAGPAALGTAGLLWSEFKNEATFLQFERPGARSTAPDDEARDCKRRRRESAADQWQRVVKHATAAVRAKEGLIESPAVYIGVGAGALAALGAAVVDSRTTALVLINADIDREFVEHVLDEVPARVSVSILQGDGAVATPRAARDLFATLQARRHPASLLTFEGVGHDFGLTTSESDCFERAVSMLGHQVRDPRAATIASQPTVVDCRKPVDAAPNEEEAITIDRVERL